MSEGGGSNKNAAEDEEKYWYQSSIAGYKNLFNDEDEISSSMKDQQNVETSKDIIRLLNGTRLDWMKESPDLEVNWEGEVVPPAQGIEEHEISRSYAAGSSTKFATKAKSARFGANATADDHQLQKSIEPLIEPIISKSYQDNVMSVSRNLTDSHVSLLPTSFYDPCEFDDTEVDTLKVVSDLILNRPNKLHSVRTQFQKEKLFKSVLSRGDGNAIIAVILYLKQTMSKRFFLKILTGNSYLKNEEAILARDHYVRFVKFCDQPDVVIKELRDLNMNEEALNYQLANFTSSYEQELSKVLQSQPKPTAIQMVDLLRNRYKQLLTFVGQLVDVPYSRFISHHMYLMDVKKRIFTDFNNNNVSSSSGGQPQYLSEPMVEIARIRSPIELLRFCLKNDGRVGQLKLPDPAQICERFNLTDRQNAFSVAIILAELNAWTELSNHVLKKGLAARLTTPALSKSAPWHIMADIAYGANAPPAVIANYVKYIPETEDRFEKAQKFNCYDLAVECLKDLRNREKLEVYRRTIPKDDPAYIKATSYLETMTTASQSSSAVANLSSMAKEKFRFKDVFKRK